METDRNKYGLNVSFFTYEEKLAKIKRLEQDLIRTETFLEILWEAVRRENETR
jgi:hypothetical protein